MVENTKQAVSALPLWLRKYV